MFQCSPALGAPGDVVPYAFLSARSRSCRRLGRRARGDAGAVSKLSSRGPRAGLVVVVALVRACDDEQITLEHVLGRVQL